MSEMVERVARAMCALITEPGLHPERYMATYMVLAHKAIEAMREPTEAMKTAALSATFDDKGVGDRVYVGDVPIIWRAMIDAALKEQP